MATLIADSTGAGDYLTISAAVTAASAGDTIICRGTFFENVIISGKDGLTIRGNSPTDRFILSGLRTIDDRSVTDLGSGLFAISGYITRPPSVLLDFGRDDTTGTITGVTTSNARFDKLRVLQFVGTARSIPTITARYGHIARNASTPTTPGLNRWGYSASTLYVQLDPGATIGDLTAQVRVCAFGSGIDIGSNDDITVENADIEFFGDEDESRGSILGQGSKRFTGRHIYSYDAGYRAFNLAGDTGSDEALGHRLYNCVAVCSSMPYKTTNNTVFDIVPYNGSGSTNSDCVFEDCLIVQAPWIQGPPNGPLSGSTSGQTPVSAVHLAGTSYQHTGGGGAVIGGVVFRRLTVLNMFQELNLKFSKTLEPNAVGHRADNAPVAFDGADFSTYPVTSIDGLYYTRLGVSNGAAYDRCRVIVPELQNSATYSNPSSHISASASSQTYFRFSDFVFQIMTPNNSGCIDNLSGTLRFDACNFFLNSTRNSLALDAVIRHNGTTGVTVCRGCVFDRATSAASCQFVYRAGGGDGAGMTMQGNLYSTNFGDSFFYRNGVTAQTRAYYSGTLFTDAGEVHDETAGFNAPADWDLSPGDGSALLTLDNTISALATLPGINGNEYDSSYGSYQFGAFLFSTSGGGAARNRSRSRARATSLGL